MGFVGNLLRRIARGPKFDRPAAEFLGAALARQFAPGNRFDLTDEQFRAFARNVDPKLRGLIDRWTVFYLVWVTLEAARVAYGDEFRREALAAVYRGLANNYNRLPNAAKFAASMRFWFEHMDGAVNDDIDDTVGSDVPRIYFIATRFLWFDVRSFCYESPEAMKEGFKVAGALGAAQDAATPFINAMVERATMSSRRLLLAPARLLTWSK